MKIRILGVVSIISIAMAACASPGANHRGTTSAGYGRYESQGTRTSTSADYGPRRTTRYKAPAGYRSRAPRGGGATVPPPAPGTRSTREAPRRPSTQRRGRIAIRRPVERPGLGTRFGERVRSRVNFTAFRRASGRPTGMTSIHYNDHRGLLAMARHLRRRCCGAIPAYTVGAGITVQLVDRYQRPLQGLVVGSRTIVLGRHQQRYGILIRNNTARRWEIVASVDGLDVIDGRRASVHKRGYILAPWGKIFVQGFRTSGSTVAAFRFGSVRNSYVKRTTGSSRNVGVVGIAAFAEYVPRHTVSDVEKRLRARPFGNTGYARPPIY